MSELITAITEYEGKNAEGWGGEEGYKVVTTDQEILLAISNGQSCCESWGYFWSNDNPQDFIGASVLDVSVTDTALRTKPVEEWEKDYEYGLDAGEVMFVNIDTDRGKLQFAAYNAHNGYYGHEARVVSKQLDHSQGV